MRRVLPPGDIVRLALSPSGLGLVLAATGFLVWTLWSILGGFVDASGFRLREAWDTPGYFYIGVPIMALAVAAAAFVRPRRAWRWPLWLVGGHQAGVLLFGVGMQSGFSLVLLTMIHAVLLAALFAVPALVGASVARRLVERVQ